MILGKKSTLFLAFSYQFGEGGEAALASSKSWKPRRIESAALLPHLDEYVRKNELLRAYDVAGDLRGAFGGRDAWILTDGEDRISVAVVEPPRLYVLDTGYAFMVIGVAPKLEEKGRELELATMQDVAYRVTRAGVTRVEGVPAMMKKWLGASGADGEEALPLRRWLARLVPNMPADAPRGTPRTSSPALFSVIVSSDRIDKDNLHRLRLVHRSDQSVEPTESEGQETDGIWRISSRELCMFSSFGFSWVVQTDGSQFLNDAPHMIRDRYIYKWLLVEHQRLCLLALATECADMSKGLDGAHFAEMRLRLLRFVATYNFRHISNEERHNRFYTRVRDALGVEELLGEVREEVVEIDTQLSAQRAETLNHVLAFLTLVLTPVGIIVGVFQGDTLPGPFHLSRVLHLSSWGHLFAHGPFQLVVIAAILGVVVYVRLFGIETVSQLVRALLFDRRRK